MHSALTHCLQRQHLHACTNGGVRTNACAHACTLNTHSCVDTRRDMRSLPASQFPSLTLNQSFLIYQRGFVSGRLMPAPIRGKKTTQQQWKSQSKSLLWCDYTHNQIRADLNRHRTQNHIKGNSMCMALHCSRSSLILSALLSLTFLLHFFLPLFCHHHDFFLILQCWWPEKFLTNDLYSELILHSLLPAVIIPSNLPQGTNSLSSLKHR